MVRQRALLIGLSLSLGLALGGCESFEGMDSWFSTKKPLPGDRKTVFPDGVPGVPQGVPPELVKGYQPPAEPPPVVAENPKPKPRPRPRPKQVAAPAQPATQITVQPTRQRPPPQAEVRRPPPADTAFPPPPPPQAQTASPFPPPPPPPAR